MSHYSPNRPYVVCDYIWAGQDCFVFVHCAAVKGKFFLGVAKTFQVSE